MERRKNLSEAWQNLQLCGRELYQKRVDETYAFLRLTHGSKRSLHLFMFHNRLWNATNGTNAHPKLQFHFVMVKCSHESFKYAHCVSVCAYAWCLINVNAITISRNWIFGWTGSVNIQTLNWTESNVRSTCVNLLQQSTFFAQFVCTCKHIHSFIQLTEQKQVSDDALTFRTAMHRHWTNWLNVFVFVIMSNGRKREPKQHMLFECWTPHECTQKNEGERDNHK